MCVSAKRRNECADQAAMVRRRVQCSRPRGYELASSVASAGKHSIFLST
jgi:hypothetical protein